jgi:hypothetical protein
VSNSLYVAPIVIVQKPNGSIRVCVNYRALNECTVKNYFPLPRIDDLLDTLRNVKCMRHLDLRSAYNQERTRHSIGLLGFAYHNLYVRTEYSSIRTYAKPFLCRLFPIFPRVSATVLIVKIL